MRAYVPEPEPDSEGSKPARKTAPVVRQRRHPSVDAHHEPAAGRGVGEETVRGDPGLPPGAHSVRGAPAAEPSTEPMRPAAALPGELSERSRTTRQQREARKKAQAGGNVVGIPTWRGDDEVTKSGKVRAVGEASRSRSGTVPAPLGMVLELQREVERLRAELAEKEARLRFVEDVVQRFAEQSGRRH
ncbi:MAG TPA: hypothetical protein VHF22_04030 [Planctomycetota bacterium]|nr:hypothetical protein [Planctomycetota bacterium]